MGQQGESRSSSSFHSFFCLDRLAMLALQVAASDRAEAKLYPVLSIPSEPAGARAGQPRRNSTSNSTMALHHAAAGKRRNSIFN